MSAPAPTAPPQARREKGDVEIHVVSSWILRGGVIASVSVMLLGLLLVFAGGAPTVARMSSLAFSADYLGVIVGSVHGDGLALIQLGIFLLVLTPILRVASSMVIFAFHERDWFYAAVTLAVLVLTLVSLLVLS